MHLALAHCKTPHDYRRCHMSCEHVAQALVIVAKGVTARLVQEVIGAFPISESGNRDPEKAPKRRVARWELRCGGVASRIGKADWSGRVAHHSKQASPRR